MEFYQHRCQEQQINWMQKKGQSFWPRHHLDSCASGKVRVEKQGVADNTPRMGRARLFTAWVHTVERRKEVHINLRHFPTGLMRWLFVAWG
jgi:hypothetical protein